MPELSDEQLAQRAESDIYRLRLAVSDLWSNFKPPASRRVLTDHIAELEAQCNKLEKLVETLIKYNHNVPDHD
jgi:hypothetical protein